VHRLFASVVAPLIEASRPEAIAEVGVGAGRLTRRLLEAPSAAEAVVHAIDPAPTLDPDLCRAEAARLVVHADRGTAVLGSIGPVDLALLDGDPNWHSTYSELRLLARTARRADREAPLVVVHNVHWPFGRRDGYFDPEAIPLPQRREHTDLGLVPGRREPGEEGLRLAPWSAVREFEPRSGVLTAVEDFLAESELDWTLVEVPGFHGAAVLAEARRLQRQPALAAALEQLRSPRFLGGQARRAEAARLEAELELTAARRKRPQEAPPVEEARPMEEPAAPVQVPAESEPQLPTAERDALVAEAARERARREALEWQLERLEEDLAERGRRLDAVEAELGTERQALTAARVRLEGEAGELRSEREAGERLRRRVRELEGELTARDRRLEEAEEAKRLAQGRLAHSQDLAGALREEGDRLRAEVERLRTEAGAARASLTEVAAHLDRAGATRRARAARRLRQLGAPFRRPSPTALEEARAAATAALPAAPSAQAEEAEESQVEARTR
jgi:predicted  nucleic acid-binding Zn-ribbon protein